MSCVVSITHLRFTVPRQAMQHCAQHLQTCPPISWAETAHVTAIMASLTGYHGCILGPSMEMSGKGSRSLS